MLLTAAQLKENFGARTEKLPLFDTGHELIVRALPAHVADKAQNHEMHDAFVFVNAVVDAEGKRYWTDDQVEEVALAFSADVIQLVVCKSYELAAVSKERQEIIKKNWKTLTGSTSGG